jgi:hypothetical protein
MEKRWRAANKLQTPGGLGEGVLRHVPPTKSEQPEYLNVPQVIELRRFVLSRLVGDVFLPAIKVVGLEAGKPRSKEASKVSFDQERSRKVC